MQLRFLKIDNLLMALGAGLAFALSFRVNQLLDDWFVYVQGISFLFLPAGIKLLFVVIGRAPAILGIMAASVYLGYGIWPDKSIGAVIEFALISLITYPASADLVMRWLQIQRDLVNLQYWHIVVLSLAASVTNGIAHNLLYVAEDVTAPQEFWVKAAAMTFGDFKGCLVVVALFQLAVSHLCAKQVTED